MTWPLKIYRPYAFLKFQFLQLLSPAQKKKDKDNKI